MDAPAEFSKQSPLTWGAIALMLVMVATGTVAYYDLKASKTEISTLDVTLSSEIKTLDVTLSSDILTLEQRMDKRYKRQQGEVQYLRDLLYQQREKIIKLEKELGI